MAYKTLVTNPSPLARQVSAFLEKMVEQKRDFTLAMLVPSETGLSDRWNLVLSAPWTDRDGLNATIPTITSLLVKHLSNVNAHKLERISVLPTTHPLVTMMEGFQIPLGEVYEIQSLPQAEGAIVLVAAQPSLGSRAYHPQSMHNRA